MQAQRPLLLPEPYDGATGSWPEWEAHFENVAAVNKWESEEEKLMWLLTGKAQTAFMRFPEAIRNDYGESIKHYKGVLIPTVSESSMSRSYRQGGGIRTKIGLLLETH